MIYDYPAAVRLITRTRALIANPERWCAWRDAEDERGDSVEPDDPKAVRWCVYGAMAHERGDYPYSLTPLMEDMDPTCRALYPAAEGITTVNDHEGHAAVLRVLDTWLQEHTPMEQTEKQEVV